MKFTNIFAILSVVFLSSFSLYSTAQAQEVVSQDITLDTGWNIVSTPMILDSHSFSADENSENFDIYLLDASQSSGWATMTDVGQNTFTPLYGYFVNNKTGTQQTLTFNYDTSLEPNEKLFERTFSGVGWYSIGVADSEYAVGQHADRVDTNNPSKVLSLLDGKYDRVIDFTDAKYESNRRSVALSDPWKVVVPTEIDSLNDLRETKGYVVYIKEADATYNGTQDYPVAENVENTEEEIVVRTSNNDPDSSTLQVEDDSKSDWYNVFVFDLDSDDSNDDITITSISVEVEVSTSTFADIVDDAELVIADNVYDDFSVDNATSGTAVLTFDLGSGATIYPQELLAVEVQLRFNALSVGNEGMRVQARMNDVDSVVAESIDGVLGADKLSGSATGDEHTLRTSDMLVSVDSTDADVTAVDGDDNDYATFEIELEVTAFEEDIYITTDPNVSISYTLEDGSGSTSIAGTRSVALTSTADENGDYFEISEGETQTLTLHVTYSPGTSGVASRMVLNSISFATTASAPTRTHLTFPAVDYRTNVMIIVN